MGICPFPDLRVGSFVLYGPWVGSENLVSYDSYLILENAHCKPLADMRDGATARPGLASNTHQPLSKSPCNRKENNTTSRRLRTHETRLSLW